MRRVLSFSMCDSCEFCSCTISWFSIDPSYTLDFDTFLTVYTCTTHALHCSYVLIGIKMLVDDAMTDELARFRLGLWQIAPR